MQGASALAGVPRAFLSTLADSLSLPTLKDLLAGCPQLGFHSVPTPPSGSPRPRLRPLTPAHLVFTPYSTQVLGMPSYFQPAFVSQGESDFSLVHTSGFPEERVGGGASQQGTQGPWTNGSFLVVSLPGVVGETILLPLRPLFWLTLQLIYYYFGFRLN